MQRRQVVKTMLATLPAFDTVALTPMPDVETQTWIDRLRADGDEREEAVAELHALLLRAARFEIGRRRAALAHLHGEDPDDLAHQSANDALLAVLTKLDEFRGESRFTTWAYKFALYEAAVKVRRRAWQEREVALDPDAWQLIQADAAPDRDVERQELLGAVRDAITADLTPHQRRILVAVAVEGVPIDVLAQRLGTTRGALYKTVHDARRRLRSSLAAQGLHPDPSPTP